MPLITWSDKYSVQVQEFDGHHKKLVEYINELNDAMKQGKGKEVIPGLLKKLIDYTRSHFAKEEETMKKHAYPEYNAQKEAHQRLLKQVEDFKSDFEKGNLSITVNMMSFLQSWLLDHIQKMDKRYGPYFNGKGVK